MTLNWKLLAASAGGAFALSFFTGMLGKVGFGTAFVRALVWGIVFGGLAFGVEYALKTFLPGLFEKGVEMPPDEAPTVDITIEDENPHATGQMVESAAASAAASAADSAAPDVAESDETDGFDEVGPDLDPSGADDASDELVEESSEDRRTVPDSQHDDSSDELPGFASMESTFETAESGDDADESTPVSVDLLGSEEDPEIVARAVRTFMNKDKEG